MTRPRHLRRAPTGMRAPVVAAAVFAVVVAGCETPSVPGTDAAGAAGSEVPTPTPTVSSSADPDRQAAEEAMSLLLASLEQAQSAFDALSSATDEEAAELALVAVAAVAAEPASLGITRPVPQPDAPPLLPGPAQSREETIDHGDALTAATTAARDAGSLGSSLLGVLRDPIAGDLGSWQRDAAGLLDLAVQVAASSDTTEDAEAAVAELQGEALRALAWALVAARADDPAMARAAGERGSVHVSLMLRAVESLTDQP